MLVLTRRSKDKILFPQLGVTIHFIRVQSGQVKVGVDAPREITVLRDEIQKEADALKMDERKLFHLPKDVRHGIRNELHQVSVGLHLYKELMSASLEDEAADVFDQIQGSLSRLDELEALNPPANDKGRKIVSKGGGTETVLLVDDQSNEREMLASVLRLQDISVVTLADGDQAVNYFRDHPAPRYLVIDMQMPVCDGATALTKLHETSSLDETEVFALSGMSPEAYGVSVGDGGVDRWFPKPLNPKVLIEAMTP